MRSEMEEKFKQMDSLIIENERLKVTVNKA
jgi:hypothetical protein